MSEIAAEAGMSVGHIYRYFGGKDDIIAAIVEAESARMQQEMDALEADHDSIGHAVRAYVDRLVRRWSDRWRAALWLEIMAEAARNPKIAAIVRKGRKDKFDRIRAMMARGYPRQPPEEIDRRVEVLSVFLDSMAFKAVITPGFDCEEAACTLTGCVAELFED
jgi:AcrR family transcriptional regulator